MLYTYTLGYYLSVICDIYAPDSLDVIDDINDNTITSSSILVTFDIANVFPSTDNISGLERVSEILGNTESDFPPAECILEALTICFKCNSSVFDNVFYEQENRTAMDPHRSCSYSDIAMYRFDIKALNYKQRKKFRDDIFYLWNHSLKELQKFLRS